VLFHSLGAWRITPAFHDVLFLPSYLVPAAQLMGCTTLHLWHDQVFSKPPKVGSVVAWHQDFRWGEGQGGGGLACTCRVVERRARLRAAAAARWCNCFTHSATPPSPPPPPPGSYWTRTRPMGHMTVHITLDTQHETNGVLRYVPGSHRWPLLPITSKHFDDMDSIATVLTPHQLEQFKHHRAARLPTGHAAFHHPLTVHGSYANESDAPRRATVVNLFNHGTCSAVDTPLLEGLPAFPSGSELGGKFFPVLYTHPEGAGPLVAADLTRAPGAAASGAGAT
jgi:ectoine hydroxylase-related dioxygenase (phytanoyl-CoA dioxygenase family)